LNFEEAPVTLRHPIMRWLQPMLSFVNADRQANAFSAIGLTKKNIKQPLVLLFSYIIG
jgi:hypothetical protein